MQCVYFAHRCSIHPSPSILKDIHLLFVPSIKFLDLIFDSEPCWEPHLWQLWCKCEKTLNMQRFLSHSSWGNDITVLLQLYCAIIHSKIDCDSSICSSAFKQLFILEPTCNAKIQLASGAFCTGCLASVYVESGWPTLHFQKDLLLCSYAARLTTHPHHLSCSVVFFPNLCYRYEMNPGVPWPVDLGFHQLLESFHVNFPWVVPYWHVSVSAWHLS